MTLQQILDREQKHRCEGGMFGIEACKEHIKWEEEHFNKSLYQLLEDFVERANKDVFFNRAMVLACWELINKEAV